MADWSAVLLRDSLGTTDAVAPWGYAAFAVAMTGMRFAGDRLVARVGAVPLLRAGNAVAAATLAAALMTRSLPVTLGAFVIAGLALAIVAPVVFATAGRHGGASPGHGIAFVASIGYGGFLLGPPVIGWIASHAGLVGAFWVLVALLAVLGALSGRLRGA